MGLFEISNNLKVLKQMPYTNKYAIYRGKRILKEFVDFDCAKKWLDNEFGDNAVKNFEQDNKMEWF